MDGEPIPHGTEPDRSLARLVTLVREIDAEMEGADGRRVDQLMATRNAAIGSLFRLPSRDLGDLSVKLYALLMFGELSPEDATFVTLVRNDIDRMAGCCPVPQTSPGTAT